MAGPPALTTQQKRRLASLEPQLRDLAKRGDYDRAKVVLAEIQEILRASGHETRLMQSKNWLFQAAMEAGRLTVAQNGFEGVRKKTSPRTRVYLEATALRAVCLLRQGDFVEAQPLIRESLRRCGNITSDRRRAQFRRRMIERFEQEWVVSVLRGEETPHWDVNQVQAEAGHLVQTATEEEIEERLGGMVSREQVERILGVYEFSRKQLPPSERLLLPSPRERRNQKEVGRTLISSARRVVWRSICDPSSDVYKLWYDSGMRAVLDKKLVAASVLATLSGMHIGMYGLAVCLTAVILKAGLEVFCDRFEPVDLMVERSDRR